MAPDSRGFQILEAEEGVQGLRIAEKLGDALDVIVSDIQMPGGDGLTFVCAVREFLPTVPIVLISSYAEPLQFQKTSFQFLSKPSLPAALITAIEHAIAAMARRKEAGAEG